MPPAGLRLVVVCVAALASVGFVLNVASVTAAVASHAQADSVAGYSIRSFRPVDLKVEWTASYDRASGEYQLELVTVTATTCACDGLAAHASVIAGDSRSLGEEAGVFDGGAATIDFSGDEISTEDINRIAVFLTRP